MWPPLGAKRNKEKSSRGKERHWRATEERERGVLLVEANPWVPAAGDDARIFVYSHRIIDTGDAECRGTGNALTTRGETVSAVQSEIRDARKRQAYYIHTSEKDVIASKGLAC